MRRPSSPPTRRAQSHCSVACCTVTDGTACGWGATGAEGDGRCGGERSHRHWVQGRGDHRVPVGGEGLLLHGDEHSHPGAAASHSHMLVRNHGATTVQSHVLSRSCGTRQPASPASPGRRLPPSAVVRCWQIRHLTGAAQTWLRATRVLRLCANPEARSHPVHSVSVSEAEKGDILDRLESEVSKEFQEHCREHHHGSILWIVQRQGSGEYLSNVLQADRYEIQT